MKVSDSEKWHKIKGLESSQYRINTAGEILNTKSGRKLSCSHNYAGYKTVTLRIDHHVTTKFIHKLVAETFIPNPENLPIVNHKDEDKSNCNVSNLEWISFSENITYGTSMIRSAFKRQQAIEEIDEYGNVIRWWASAKYLCESVGFPCTNDSRPTSLYRAINSGKMWNGLRLRWEVVT